MTRAIIDTHVHLGTAEWMEGSLGPYRASAERFFGTTFATETVEEMAARYDRLEMTGLLLGWDAERHTGAPALPNRLIADIVARHPDTFVGFGSVDPLRPDAANRVAEVAGLGLLGIKLHPTLQGFDPAAAEVQPFFAAVAAAGLRILTHVGMSALGAGQPGGQGLRLDVAQPWRFDRIAAEYPEMPIMLAHLGAPWEAEAMAMVLHKANLFTDFSGWKLRYLPEAVLRDMRGRLSGQGCFGTDYPMFDPEGHLADFRALGLPAAVEERILGGNARRFLGLG